MNLLRNFKETQILDIKTQRDDWIKKLGEDSKNYYTVEHGRKFYINCRRCNKNVN